ncbi:MAG: DUF4412 domain-containing protein [Acidobacteria bacterium]|nr:DUF4412 domain-containing protein [Acidobacteriota bacterium]MBI3658623.1 DUF4412 domain-containing protein [Acidobacteriota bacterium]
MAISIKVRLLIIIMAALVGGLHGEGIYFEQIKSRKDPKGSPGNPTLIKTWLDGRQMRIDEKSTTLIDQVTGKIITLDHDAKSFTVLSGSSDQLKKDIADSVTQAVRDLKTAYRPTGLTKKIGAWPCSQVLYTPDAGPGGKAVSVEYWLTEELGVNFYEVYNIGPDPFLKNLEPYARRDRSLLDKLPRGFPVLTITRLDAGGNPVVDELRLTKFEKRKIEAETFKVPRDYQ